MCFFRSTSAQALVVAFGFLCILKSTVADTGRAIKDARVAEETEILGLGITIFVVIIVAGVLAAIGILVAVCFCCSCLCFARRKPSGPIGNGHDGGKHVGPPNPGNFKPVYPQNAAPGNLPNKPLPPLPVKNHSLQAQPLYGNEPQPKRPTDLPFADPMQSHGGPVGPHEDQPYGALYSGSFPARPESVTSGDANYVPNRFKPAPPGKMTRNDPTWNAITNEVKSWQKAHDIYYTRSRNHDPYASNGNEMSPEENEPDWNSDNSAKANFMY